MDWFTKRSTPKCDSTVREETSKSKSDEEVLQLLSQAVNSSRQRPKLAAIHNQDQIESDTPQLLSMPINILNRILRHAVVERSPIPVAADEPEECSEKSRGILSVCKHIRKVARPMFYRENRFEIQVFFFDIKAVMPWMKIAKEPMASTRAQGSSSFDDGTWKAKKRFARSYQLIMNQSPSSDKTKMMEYFTTKLATRNEHNAGTVGQYYVIPKYEPHWENLIDWLYLFYKGKVDRYYIDEASPEFSPGVSGMFDLVEHEKEEGREWSMFQRRLPGYRKLLGMADKRWLIET